LISGPHVTVAVQGLVVVVMAWPCAFKTHWIAPVASAVPVAVTDRFNPPGHDASTQPVAVAVPPCGTVTTGGLADPPGVHATNPGIVTTALRSTALGLVNVTVTVTRSLAVLAGNTKLAVPFPLTATVELNARLQERLIGTTVTEALAEQTELAAAHALAPLVAPVALVTLTVSGNVCPAGFAVVYVVVANAVTVCPIAIVAKELGVKLKPVLSLIATLLRAS